MDTAVIDWLLEVLPPESGPLLQWAAVHFDVARPVMLLGFSILLLAELWLLAAAWRWIRS